MNFEQAVKEAAEKTIVKFVAEGHWLMPNGESRFKIPAEWIQSIWALVDGNSLKVKIAERIEQELADRIINAIAQELATDIKQVLSVKERREAIRAVARDHIEHIMRAGVDA